jgi:hypothetical protein
VIQYTDDIRFRSTVGFALFCIFAATAYADENPPSRMRGKLWVNPVEFTECARETAIARGDTVILTGTGLGPNESVEITFSQGDVERSLTTAKANAQGALSVRVTVPADATTDTDARMHAIAQKGTDGIGLALNSAPLQVFPNTDDTDGDGIKDMCDNCPKIAGSDLTDLDGDGLGDGCDPCPTDPENGAGSGTCADGNANPDVPISQP